MRTHLYLLALCSMALILPACGNYDKDNSTAASTKGETERSAHEKQHPGLPTVQILDMQFRPASLVVKKGDTVLWVNQDMLAHDVTEAQEKRWASGRMEAGSTWRKAIDESTEYFCSLHAVMKGKIVVENSVPMAGKYR